MRPTDKIDNLIKNTLKTSASPELDQRIDTLVEQSKPAQPRPLNRWSIIMKSNITKSAAAALILIGTFILLTQTNGTGLVLADVIEKFSQPYECRQTVYYGDQEHHVITLYRLNLSQRREERPNNEVFIVDMRTTPVRTLFLYKNEKFAKVTNDYGMGPLKDPDLLQMLSNMETGNAEKLGVQTIDGIQAEGFRTVGKYNDITIWGNVETGLPVKVIIIHPQHDRKIVFDNFQFDVAFDLILFSTDPPEGYRVHEVSLNQDANDSQSDGTDMSLPETPEGAESFISHSCVQTVYRNSTEVGKAKILHKTLSLRREEHFDDGSIHVIDISERPVKILRMDPDTLKATLRRLYNMGPAKNPDLLAMLARMRNGDAEKIGIQDVDGFQAEGFQTVDPYNDITIWSNTETGLPVKIEILHPKAKQEIVMDQFDFETEMDDSLFLMTPPEGYELIQKDEGVDTENPVSREN